MSTAASGAGVRNVDSADAARAARVFLAVSAAWAAIVIALYYNQLWALIGAGPAGWSLPDLGQDLRATGLPHVREAAGRALAAASSSALVVCAMLGGGALVDRWLLPPGLAWRERFVVRFANGAGVLGMALFILALAGAYRPPIVRTGVTAFAVVALVAAFRGWRNRTGRFGPSDSAKREMPLFERLWMGVTAIALLLAFVTALAPEIEYDALWYHLELPRRWLAAGSPVDDVNEYVSLYPLTWELLFGAALAFDGSVAAKLVHWTTLLAGAVLASSFGIRVLGARNGWIAAGVFVTAPTVFWEGTTAYVDLALAVHAGVAIGALWRSTRDEDTRWILLAGTNLGLGCATKHLGLAIAAVAIGLYTGRQIRLTPPAKLVRTVILLSALTLAVPSPWYVRSWLASGNPVFPEMHGVFGASPPERWDERTEAGVSAFKDRFGRPRSLAAIVTLPWDMTMHGARYGGTLGPFVLLLVPAVAVLARRRPSARWLLAGVIAFLLVWASPLSSYQARFLVPWWLFASPLIAGAIALTGDTAHALRTPARPATHAALALVALLNLPPFTVLHERDRIGWSQWLTHVVHRVPVEVVLGGIDEGAWLRSQVRSYAAWEYLNARAPRDARVLTFFGGDHFYSQRARLWSEAVAARPMTWDCTEGDPRELIDRLHGNGITHIIVPPRRPNRTEAHDRLLLLRPETLSHLTLVHRDFWAEVYRLDVEASPRNSSARGDPATAVGTAGRTDHRYGR